MTTQLTIRRVLCVPTGEIGFIYPHDAKPSRTDKKYKTLRIERRGLRRWNSFQENPAYLQAYLDRYSACPQGWKPHVTVWQRYASSERIVQDLYGLTLIHRVNIALDAVAPGQLSIIGTPKQFSSYGTETSRPEGGQETRIAPDWALVYGEPSTVSIANTADHVIAWGDTKLNYPGKLDHAAIPGTVSCREAYLAQVVQYCTDWSVPFGFVLTNIELIIFHVINVDKINQRFSTPSSYLSTSELQSLPSDAPEEHEFSSPLHRETEDWVNFNEGDDEISLLTCEQNKIESPLELTSAWGRDGDESLSPAPHQVPQTLFYEPRHTTPEPPNSSQQSSLHPDISPCPPDTHSRRYRTPTASPRPASQSLSTGQQDYRPESRSVDPTHVLIKTYPTDKEGVAQRLFELCMLAKEAKDNGVLGIGPQKLSFMGLYT